MTTATPGRETTLPVAPAEVGASRHEADLFHDVLADVGNKHVASSRVPVKALGVTQTQGIDLAECVRVPIVRKRIVGGNAVLAVGAVGAQRGETQNLPEG